MRYPPPPEEVKISDNVKALVTFEETQGVIALLDALGIKGIWSRRDPKEVLNAWSTVQNEFTNSTYQLSTELRSAGYFDKLRFEAFSDTIMISLPVKNREVGNDIGRNPLWWTLMSMGEMLGKLLRIAILNRFYFRGCLSAGIFYRSEAGSMIIGPAVDEAAQYHQRAQWIGISTTPSASKILNKTEEMAVSSYDYFVRYAIPLKVDIQENGWAVNWLRKVKTDEIQNQSLKQILIDESALTKEASVSSKYKNTINFYDSVNKSSAFSG